MVIRGVVPAHNILKKGYPFDLAIQSWLKVCDEITIVIDRNNSDDWLALRPFVIANDRIRVRGISRPIQEDIMRFLGCFFPNYCPDFTIHFDLDYLISPSNAQKLREAIESADKTTDIITYTLTYLNYDATRTLFIEAMTRYNHPYNGYQYTYPFILNSKRQNFVSPFEGVAEDNLPITEESVISFSPHLWGKCYDTKFLFGNTNFNVVHSNVVVEHLSFSLPLDVLAKKLDHEYWRVQNIDLDYVMKGHDPYTESYPHLETARHRYRDLRDLPSDPHLHFAKNIHQ